MNYLALINAIIYKGSINNIELLKLRNCLQLTASQFFTISEFHLAAH
jgi:hypothetical protein